MLNSFCFCIVLLLSLQSLAIAAPSGKFVFVQSAECWLSENKSSKWVKVGSNPLGDRPVKVTTSKSQPSYYYVKDGKRWVAGPKICFMPAQEYTKPTEPPKVTSQPLDPVVAENTQEQDQWSAKRSAAPDGKWFVHLSAMGWTEQFNLTNLTLNKDNSINASQIGGMLGISRSGSFSDEIIWIANIGGFFASSKASQKTTTITYSSNGSKVYGGLAGFSTQYYFANLEFSAGIQPFVTWRSGDWATPTSTVSKYDITDKTAIRYGVLLDLRKTFGEYYVSPQGGFIQKPSNLIWILQVGKQF